MYRLIFILVVLIASVWVGVAFIKHPGYLLISFKPWLVQMPVWFAVLLLVLAFFIFYLLINSADRIHFLWFRLKNWLKIRSEHKSYNQTQHGLATLIEGRWAKAEKLLLKGAHQSFDPLMNYLGAAKAAHEQSAFDRRDQYLQKAYEVAPNAQLAIGLTQAELLLAHGQTAFALHVLEKLHQVHRKHPRVIKLLEKAYVRLADWDKLIALFPYLRKANVINAIDYDHFEKHVYVEKINAMQHANREPIDQLWQALPRKISRSPDIVLAYVKHLLRFQAYEQIESLIRKVLKHHWQGDLVKIYGSLPFSNYQRQLVIVGAWLKMYGERPETLYTLARLCIHNQLWGKAKDYFERCLALGSFPEAAYAYGQLLEELNEDEKALDVYRLTTQLRVS